MSLMPALVSLHCLSTPVCRATCHQYLCHLPSASIYNPMCHSYMLASSHLPSLSLAKLVCLFCHFPHPLMLVFLLSTSHFQSFTFLPYLSSAIPISLLHSFLYFYPICVPYLCYPLLSFCTFVLPDLTSLFLHPTGREKLELGEVRIKVVLEADGTQVEDPEYFCTLPENTVFLLLRQGEHWYPAGVEVLRQGS